ncbi:hypothetical protein FSARC_3873, partial [Fusarium sarcochroum]
MMMSSNFLESAGDGDGAARFGHDWMNGIDTTAMPFSGLDASFEASTVSFEILPNSRERGTTNKNTQQQNPLQSPETPSLDNTVFPSPLTDFAYLDRPFGDFPSNGYAIPPTTPGQFPVHPHRTSSTFSEGYDLSSGSPSLGPVWPAHVSPAATFLPTPPMADELSAAESEPEGDNRDDDDYDDDEDSEPATKKRKRPAATNKSKAKGKDGKRNPTQLRTASRAPKKRGAAAAQPRHPSESMEEVKARAAHNQVEQQYRKRLNTHFERLLAVLPAPGTEGGIANDRRVSKAEVLDLARERIRALEKQTS